MTNQPITVIGDPPIPTSVDDAVEFQADHPSFNIRDEWLHPDELYERYVDVLGENNAWRIYEVQIYGFEGVYVWNHQMGYGIRFNEADDFRLLLDAMTAVADAVI